MSDGTHPGGGERESGRVGGRAVSRYLVSR